MKNYFLLLACSVLLLLASCQSKPADSGKTHSFFDLTGYFNDQLKQLENSNFTLQKTITKDGQTETVIVDSVNWKNELHSFIESNLDKPAYHISYNTDSVINGNSKTLFYSARDSTLLIKTIKIHLNQNVVDTIYINKVISNGYVKSGEDLYYYGNGNFEIRVSNTPRIGKNISFVLTGNTTHNLTK